MAQPRILAEEEGDGPTDWEEVERLSSELLGFRVQLLLYRRNKSEPGL